MKTSAKTNLAIPQLPFHKRLQRDLQKNWKLYLLFLPVLIYFFIFKYAPMFGLSISFMDYKPARGFANSKWVGLKHFKNFFGDPYFFRLLGNTVTISLSTLIFSFPSAILLALLINELRSRKLSRVVQTVSYIPHFISTVVLCGIVQELVGRTGGVTMLLCKLFGMEQTNMLMEARYFVPIYIGSDIWQSVGWNSIVYLSALTSIDQELYEAAKVDGANRFHCIRHITIPGLMPTYMVMLLMSIAGMLSNGMEQYLVFENAINKDVIEVLDLYVYNIGIKSGLIPLSTVVGIFKSLVGVTLLFGANGISRAVRGESII